MTLTSEEAQRVLRAAGVASLRRRHPPWYRSRRPRRAPAGLLSPLDGRPFAGFGPTEPVCSLLAAIDDATGAVLTATFRVQEDAAGHRRLLPPPGAHRRTPRRRLDRWAGHLRPPRVALDAGRGAAAGPGAPPGGARTATPRQPPIVAASLQARGRIERLWSALQDGPGVELALAGITTPAAGDVFLATPFLPAFHAQWAVPATMAPSVCRPVPRGMDLDRAGPFHSGRQVVFDNSVPVNAVVLPRTPGPHRRSDARAPADVVQCLDGRGGSLSGSAS
jgi:hypothetical protein